MPRPYPLHFDVKYSERFSRVQLALRIVLFVIIGLLGFSLGALFLVLYLALPAFAAINLSEEPPQEYLEQDGPRIARVLRWVMAVYAYFALLDDRPPTREPDGQLELEIHFGGRPTPATALLRILFGIPSALVLTVVMFFASIAWVIAFVLVLVRERYGHGLFEFQTGVLRWMVRLLAYQASIVEPYPPFSLGEAAPPAAVPSA